MEIREFHKKYVIVDIVILLAFLIAFFYFIFFDDDLRTCDYYLLFILIICIVVPVQLYAIGFESKKYNIDNDGIKVTWLNVFKIVYKWSEFRVVRIETIKSFFAADFEEEAIVFSKKALKMRDMYNNNTYKKVIDLGWVQNHPYNVVTILLKDLHEGQLEEIWSYVPERFKT